MHTSDRVAGFVLAAVENLQWCERTHGQFCVNATGCSSKLFRYPHWVDKAEFPFAWSEGRGALLEESALSQGGNVVHCEHSYYRGPLSLATLLRRLFDLMLAAYLAAKEEAARLRARQRGFEPRSVRRRQGVTSQSLAAPAPRSEQALSHEPCG